MKLQHAVLALAFLSPGLMGGLASMSLSGGVALAQGQDHHDNHEYVEHKDWKKGAHISHDDWGRGDQVDYRQVHLAAPPSGYEWRMIDGYYILANISTFQIRAVVRVQ